MMRNWLVHLASALEVTAKAYQYLLDEHFDRE